MKSKILRKTCVAVILSFSFLALITSIASAQNTYAQEVKVEGGADPRGIIATGDGGNALLFVNFDSDDFLLRKVTASGKKVWQKEFHQDDFQASAVTELSDGNYVLTGNTDNGGSAYPSLLKLTAAGKIDWQKSFPESSFLSYLTSAVPSSDGGFFAAGSRDQLFGNFGLIVAGFESSGQMRWGKFYTGEFIPTYPAIFITPDQDLIVVAEIYSQSKGEGTLVLKLDSSGNLIWKRALMKKNVYFVSGAVTNDGGCILNFSSNRSTNVFLIRLSPKAAVQLKKRFFAVDSQGTWGNAVTQSADGGFEDLQAEDCNDRLDSSRGKL